MSPSSIDGGTPSASSCQPRSSSTRRASTARSSGTRRSRSSIGRAPMVGYTSTPSDAPLSAITSMPAACSASTAGTVRCTTSWFSYQLRRRMPRRCADHSPVMPSASKRVATSGRMRYEPASTSSKSVTATHWSNAATARSGSPNAASSTSSWTSLGRQPSRRHGHPDRRHRRRLDRHVRPSAARRRSSMSFTHRSTAERSPRPVFVSWILPPHEHGVDVVDATSGRERSVVPVEELTHVDVFAERTDTRRTTARASAARSASARSATDLGARGAPCPRARGSRTGRRR